jgi:phosphopantothenoylcysteine decarboxylase/phosphopantothenate--cysteine ligase
VVEIVVALGVRSRRLAGRRVVVTAGPTLEPIDPVRVITNRSSGKMGYAVATAAREAGADVTLITGPTALDTPAGVRVVPIETVAELKDAVLASLPDTDAVIMAAAASDYRAAEASGTKLKKREVGDELTLRLVRTPDVLAAVASARRPGTLVVGFKAETGDPVAEAGRMLKEKGLDLVVANDVSRDVFGSESDQVTFVSADGAEPLPRLAKAEVARRLVEKIAERLAS